MPAILQWAFFMEYGEQDVRNGEEYINKKLPNCCPIRRKICV
jgi:hypothetical protein